MIKGFLSIIYNNIISTCYDTNKDNSNFVNINNNRELFKNDTSLYNDIKLTKLDLCLNEEKKDLLINYKNNYDLNHNLNHNSKDDLNDNSKDDLNDDSKDDLNDDSKDYLNNNLNDDFSSCCSDIYDKVEDILD